MKNRKGLVSGKQLRIARPLGIALGLLLACLGFASAQTWEAAPPFPGSGAGTAILTTTGDILVQELTGPGAYGGYGTGNWYVLHPDSSGSYSTGFWGGPTSTPVGYAPQFFGSAVLPGGRVLIEGGEYNGPPPAVDTNQGAIFDPIGGTFVTSVNPPSGWSAIGDAPTVVLPNKTFMMGDCCSTKQALFDAQTLTWTSTGTGKLDNNSEEGWTLLPNGKVLAIDTQNGLVAELYNPAKGSWSKTGSLKFPGLSYNCGLKIVPELGPAVLRPDGTVFATGANGYTEIYNSKTGKWSLGPIFPPNSAGLGQDGVVDGPAALLTDGNVLVMASNINPCFVPPSDFFEFDGTSLISVPGPPNAPNEVSFDGRMLELPTGHILFTDGTQDVEIYRPSGIANGSWAPQITSWPKTITKGHTYTIKGTQFNGLSQGAAYGDDAQMATNFPLVQISIGGFSYYLPTKNFSTMGVATGTKTVTAQFDLPFSIGKGAATIVVQVNGITSNKVSLTVK